VEIFYDDSIVYYYYYYYYYYYGSQDSPVIIVTGYGLDERCLILGWGNSSPCPERL
jgi:hypothetical protein